MEGRRSHLSNQSWWVAVCFVNLSVQLTLTVCGGKNEDTADIGNMYQRMKIQLVRFFLFQGSSVVLSNEERSLLTVFSPIDALSASDDVFHYVTSQLALLRRGGGGGQHAEEASFDAGGFAIFFFFLIRS
ncbi:hypothetical protein TcG_02671 [Trypanosoma cruzi]|nr:hypothetical protein TcG_02671 [Trypanosoma cruzi]